MHGGDATHLRTEPLQKTVQFYSPNMTKEAKEQQEKMDVKLIAGFYKPKGEEEEEEERDAVEPEVSSLRKSAEISTLMQLLAVCRSQT